MKKGSYIDMEYVYGTLSNSDGEYPLDYPALCQNPADFFVVAEQAVTGKVKYFSRIDIRIDHYQILMASSSIPGVNRPFEINGVPYFDGALGDPVPIEKAFLEGCQRVVFNFNKTDFCTSGTGPRSCSRKNDSAQISKISRKYAKSCQKVQ